MANTLIAMSVAGPPPSAVVTGFKHVATVLNDRDPSVGFQAQIPDVPVVEVR